ncbi:MAG: PAS domain S-box protein [Chthoniobacteraceae bacterium]
MKRWFSGLSVPGQLRLILVFLILPNVLMLYFFVTGINANIRFAELEQKGSEFQRPLEDLLELIPQHGRLSEQVSRDAPTSPELVVKQRKIDSAMTTLLAVDARLGRELQFTDEGLAKRDREHFRPATLRAEWEGLRARLSEHTPAARAERHRHLVSDVREMIRHVGDMSNLILDPDLDSYYLMDVTLLALPAAKHRLAEIIAYGREALQDRKTLPRRRSQLAIHAALLRESALDRVTGSVRTALNEDANFYGTSASLQAELPAALENYIARMEGFISLNTRIADGEELALSPEEYLAAGSAARSAAFQLWAVAERELRTLLERRIDHYRGRRTLSMAVAGCALLAAVAFMAVICRGVTRPLRRQAAALAAGNEELRAEVAERVRAEESLRESEARVRAVVDSALDAVVKMDTTGRIIGWNPQAEVIFGWKHEEVIGRTLSETIVPAQHREAHERGMKRFIATGEARVLNRRIEITALRRGGEEFDIELAITQIKMQERMEFCAFLRDITARKRQEAEMAELNKQIADASRRAGMAEVATGVLHNVGNVLNSVNISLETAAKKVASLKAGSLAKVAALLQEHAANPAAFFAGAQGAGLPVFLSQLAEHFVSDQASVLGELRSLKGNVEHINEIVAMQQRYAGLGGVTEILAVSDVIEDALHLNSVALDRHGAVVVREFDASLPAMPLDRHRILQILVNLIRNAKYAMDEPGACGKQLTVRTRRSEATFDVAVIDMGVGISPENLTRIFAAGFTTKRNGHGFGLHSSALAARGMGGALRVESEGTGRGTTFTLELPLPLSAS